MSAEPQPLPAGLYEVLVDEGLDHLLNTPRVVPNKIRKVDEEESPALEAAQISRLIEPVLRSLKSDPKRREELLRKLIETLASIEEGSHLIHKKLVFREGRPSLLEEVFDEARFRSRSTRPATSLSTSSLPSALFDAARRA